MKRRTLIGLVLALLLVLGGTVPVFAAAQNVITITGAPAYVCIATAQNTWTINGINGDGKMRVGKTYYADNNGITDDTVPPTDPVEQADCYFHTVNTSTCVTDISVNIPDFTGGDASANSNTGSATTVKFGAYSWCVGMALPGVIAESSNSANLVTGLLALTDLYWGVTLSTRTNAWSSSSSMTSLMTIDAVAE